MRIAVTGINGQVTRAIQRLGSADLQILPLGRPEFDITSPKLVRDTIRKASPHVIVSAAAYTAVDKAELEQAEAFSVNRDGPRTLAEVAKEHNIPIIHLSTDYVFDGGKVGYYQEDDERNPLGAYGKSKAAGEIAIEQAFKGVGGQYAIFRTSWVYGDGGNFIRTILRLAKDREELKIIHDQHGVPTSAQWLAKITLELALGNDQNNQLKQFTSGIYHAVPGGETTWHGLACLAVDAALKAGASLKVNPELIRPILAVEYPLPAPRPMNSRMDTEKLRKAIARDSDVSKLQQWSGSWEAGVQTYVQALVKDGLI